MFDNTQSEFYTHWSREQLVDELVRLNKLLKEIAETLGEEQK